jgi:hypothetical protein
MFKNETTLSYDMLHTMVKQGAITPDMKVLLREYFDELILTKEELLANYLNLKESEGVTEGVNDGVKIPRRYGKKKIMKDVKRQGGTSTNLQKAALAVNDLKNVWMNLSGRYVKDMHRKKKLLSDKDCRDIIATVDIVKKRMKEILKRKIPE